MKNSSKTIKSRVTLRREAFKVPEPCAGKLARTVLRGRKLPGAAS